MRRPWSLNERFVSYAWNDERATVRRIDAARRRRCRCLAVRTRFRLRREIDGDDVALAHHPRLGAEVDGQRELAAVGRDVEVLGFRLPRRQREAGSGERVAAAAGGDVADVDVRLAAVGEPMVPEAEFRALGDVRLDLRVLPLLLALRLLRVGGEIRPHPGHERDPLAVGEPFDRRTAGGERRQPPRFAAVRARSDRSAAPRRPCASR